MALTQLHIHAVLSLASKHIHAVLSLASKHIHAVLSLVERAFPVAGFSLTSFEISPSSFAPAAKASSGSGVPSRVSLRRLLGAVFLLQQREEKCHSKTHSMTT